MSFYVYIIQSKVDESFYKGFSEDPLKRLLQHNAGETLSTRFLIPWKLVYVEQMASKTEALIREKNLKKATRERIHALLTHPKNIVIQFIREGDL
ncbi:GIY-YIG nuclease family protein [Paraflavitalea soli]|uniref:GIY-YIG nuclease family protein n=1 Tax=Paraflavitalea soli TaxID=2315862 RepID=A0A3B7MYM7_9BACT|nr:GIY-YIG nuclease family protein [Paraflavitalea soli]